MFELRSYSQYLPISTGKIYRQRYGSVTVLTPCSGQSTRGTRPSTLLGMIVARRLFLAISTAELCTITHGNAGWTKYVPYPKIVLWQTTPNLWLGIGQV